MEAIFRQMHIVLEETATIQIYAYPNFLVEFCLAVLLAFIHVYLCVEVSKIYQYTIKLRPHTVHFRKAYKGNISRSSSSVCTSVTRVQHCKFDFISGDRASKYSIPRNNMSTTHVEWLLHQPGDFFKPIFEEKTDKHFMDRMAALTPAQYVKLDRERQKRNRQIKGCMHSLTTIFDNMVNKRPANPKAKMDQVKEDVACRCLSDQVLKYFDAESVTESLINVLNEVVEESSEDHNFPIRGELATLIYDIGNLREEPSQIFDTKCELVSTVSDVSTLKSTSS